MPSKWYYSYPYGHNFHCHFEVHLPNRVCYQTPGLIQCRSFVRRGAAEFSFGFHRTISEAGIGTLIPCFFVGDLWRSDKLRFEIHIFHEHPTMARRPLYLAHKVSRHVRIPTSQFPVFIELLYWHAFPTPYIFPTLIIPKSIYFEEV